MQQTPELEKLARLIDESGLSRRQFAMRVLGRAESSVQRWFDHGKIRSAMPRAWVRSCERVELRDGRITVTLRVYAPTRREVKAKSR